MRPVAWIVMALVGGCVVLSSHASAAVKVTEKTRYYPIKGTTGAALLKAMDGRGPKHGFLTRAIAQTGYSVVWKIEWSETAKACRVSRVNGELAVTYTFPQATGNLSPEMKRRWRIFLAGVKKHERTHSVMARRMVNAVEKSLSKLTVRNDPGCRKTRREANRRKAAIYADYEARQNRFDAREHRDGGYVQRLIDAFVRSGGV